jgi:hypothetical protein
MENKTIKTVNVTTGEETLREPNAKEIAQYQKDKANNEARQTEQAEAQALKDSANAKLAALGLTPEEIAAITA